MVRIKMFLRIRIFTLKCCKHPASENSGDTGDLRSVRQFFFSMVLDPHDLDENGHISVFDLFHKGQGILRSASHRLLLAWCRNI